MQISKLIKELQEAQKTSGPQATVSLRILGPYGFLDYPVDSQHSVEVKFAQSDDRVFVLIRATKKYNRKMKE